MRSLWDERWGTVESGPEQKSEPCLTGLLACGHTDRETVSLLGLRSLAVLFCSEFFCTELGVLRFKLWFLDEIDKSSTHWATSSALQPFLSFFFFPGGGGFGGARKELSRQTFSIAMRLFLSLFGKEPYSPENPPVVPTWLTWWAWEGWPRNEERWGGVCLVLWFYLERFLR